MTLSRLGLLFLLLSALTAPGLAADPKEPAYTDPKEADDDFVFQGEYAGEVETDEGKKKFGVQLIALGDGKFDAVAYPGNSGGPVLDPASGKVIGVINMVLTKAGREGALSAPSGIAYAIPVVRVHELLKR